MKKTATFIIFLMLYPYSYAYTTEASKFAQTQYAASQNIPKAKINAKKEHTLDFDQNACGKNLQTVKFGWGNLKIKGRKKRRITYLVTFDENGIPFWSSINFYE